MKRKANWGELTLGNIYYVENWNNHKPNYHKVKIIDINEKKVIYQYEDGWKEYITKNMWKEYYLLIDDKQLTLGI